MWVGEERERQCIVGEEKKEGVKRAWEGGCRETVGWGREEE